MFLKSLTLKGFKSFADTTILDMEPGITVVVGPNGSGKSNVVDAIGWVLGAQAPSAVRSQKMDDVIFAGTTKRAALGRAEVGLTIDNSAGLLPIDFSEVTITRTLFRSGDSEYAINGVPCRLLDIQELLSDTGVGRQQHVIVSQGQIDAVLNARPEDRRLVVEEAAGVLKYRKRKEKAERRLAATEGNLTRLQDLLREVRRQLRPLERQAEAARRHGDLIAELTGLRVHLAGRELTTLRTKLASNSTTRTQLGAEETATKAKVAELDEAIAATETQLAAIGGDDLGDLLARCEALREKARGLTAVLTERRRGIERERQAFVDETVITALEAESAELARELAEVEHDIERLAPETESLATAEAELGEQRAAFEVEWADGVAAPSGQAAEVRGELVALRAAVDRGQSEIARVRSRLESVDAKVARLAAEAERLEVEIEAATTAQPALAEARTHTERDRVEAEGNFAQAEANLRSAESERSSWSARAEALAQALDEVRAKAGAEKLADLDGVLGTLLELVDIDEGWESAFEAAAGEALSAVIVDDADAGRAALAALHANEATGAVLALSQRRPPRLFPQAGEPLRRYVRGHRPGVEELLDALVGDVVVVDGTWDDALTVALEFPEAVIVTKEGDRFALNGWRVGGTTTGATGAALDEARQRADLAVDAATTADAAVAGARATLTQARQAEAEAARAADSNERKHAAAVNARQRVENDQRDATNEADGLRSHVGELLERAERDQARLNELEAMLPALEAEEAGAAEQSRLMAAARSRLEERAAAVGAMRTDLEVRTAGLTERRQFVGRRLTEVEERLARNVVARQEAEERRVVLDQKHIAVERLSALVAARLEIIETELAHVYEQRRRQSEETRAVNTRLDQLRRERSAAEQALYGIRERLQRSEIDDAELRLRIETAVESVRRDLDTEPAAAMEAECPPLAEGVTAAGRVRELERELRIMGPINPLALQEYEELQERHQFVQTQLDDVKATRRELAKVIRAIDEEIVNVFAGAYADVSTNFEQLFDMLFPGGRGRLILTDPDNLLETGIEVEARPSGKNVRKLSLLSGGERSLTALAFLFAVFRSRPSPFYVMDEVEAALDDVNLHRFLDLIQEFRREAQLIIVSHQKRTMEAADCLYGVTMQPGGSSRVVSEKVTTATANAS